jgi:hypothetical protein
LRSIQASSKDWPFAPFSAWIDLTEKGNLVRAGGRKQARHALKLAF